VSGLKVFGAFLPGQPIVFCFGVNVEVEQIVVKWEIQIQKAYIGEQAMA
jgi:hypothetical protein